MPRPHPREFREDVIRVARNREPGVRIKDVAADFGISEDELELHVVPVLLGGGARFFDSLGTAEVRLEQVRAVEARRRAPPVHGGDMTAAPRASRCRR